MRLGNDLPPVKKGPILYSQPSRCFTILITLRIGGQDLRVRALLDSGASACFLDEDFVQRHKFSLVQKSSPNPVEVINGRPLSSEDVTYETTPIDLVIHNHHSSVAFNVIRTPSNPVIIGLSWLEMFNPRIDWKSQSLTFPSSSPTTNVHHLQTISENSSKGPQPNSQKPKMQKPLFVGARAFMRAAKTGSIFVVYANPLSKSTRTNTVIPEQYREF